jgi:hypothetical protein
VCSGGAIIKGVDEKSEAAKVAADWGTMVHHWKATGEIKTVNGRENLPPLFMKKLRESSVEREQWWPSTLTHEIAVAVNPLRQYAEYRGADGDAWKRSFGADWCTGTVDGYDWLFDSVLWVDDLKTGKEAPIEDHIEQLRFYALGLARVIDYRGPVHLTVTHWPRYPVIGTPQRTGVVMEQDELLDFEKRLAALRDTILYLRDGGNVNDELNPGDKQCAWCPGRGGCPEYVKIERRSW